MIVVDASAVVEALIGGVRGHAIRERFSAEDLAAPDILDVEVASALRGLWLGRYLNDQRLARAVVDLRRMPVDRHPTAPLITRIMQLRANLTTYDASYVALAEGLGCGLVTSDRRIARAPGIRCRVEVRGDG